MKTYQLVGIGNAVVDVISQCDDSFLEHMGIEKGIMQLIERDRGEVLYAAMNERVQTPGGSVANTIAGAGALGLEALSRGAAHVTFVDDGRVAQGLIRKNIELTRSADSTDLVRRDATRLGQNPNAAYDLIFLDPPYGKSLGQKAIAAAIAGGWLAEGALLVWEENAPMAAPDGFELQDARKYGDTHISLMWRSVSG